MLSTLEIYESLIDRFLRSPPNDYGKNALAFMRQAKVPIRDLARGHPLQDEWSEFTANAVEKHLATCKGFLYVAETSQYPEVFKVGFTKKSVSERLAALSSTATIYPFREVFSLQSHDCCYVERAFHSQTRRLGVPYIKEFYRMESKVAIATLSLINSTDASILLNNGVRLP